MQMNKLNISNQTVIKYCCAFTSTLDKLNMSWKTCSSGRVLRKYLKFLQDGAYRYIVMKFTPNSIPYDM